MPRRVGHEHRAEGLQCSSTQGFRLAQLAAGVLSIRTATNQALQIPGSSTANGANVVAGTVAGQAPEQFVFIANGGGSIEHQELGNRHGPCTA
jgi:hypothetical protein